MKRYIIKNERDIFDLLEKRTLSTEEICSILNAFSTFFSEVESLSREMEKPDAKES